MEESELIDSFILGNLKGEELLLFTERLRSDTSLLKQVNLRRAIISVMEDNHDNYLKKMLGKTDRRIEIEGWFSKLKLGKVAAFIILAAGIISLAYYVGYRSSQNRLADSDPPEIGLPNEMSAGNNTSFANAMNEFKLKKYGEAFENFRKLAEKNPLNDTLEYFTGISAFRSGDLKIARRYFGSIVLRDSGIYKQKAYFRLGLCFLKEGDKFRAREIFEKIASDPQNIYSKNSQKILKSNY